MAALPQKLSSDAVNWGEAVQALSLLHGLALIERALDNPLPKRVERKPEPEHE